MAVVVTGLEIFGDVGKCREILWILSCAWDVTDLMFRYDILQKTEETERIHLIFIIHLILICPQTTITAQQFCFWVNCHFHICQRKSIFSCFHFIEISSAKNHWPMGQGHRYSQASPLYEFPFLSFFLINSPFWSYSTVGKKNEKWILQISWRLNMRLAEAALGAGEYRENRN